ncbi:hypothetical protein CgunFtcFv8_020272 [Champsocephalus gunnari]|uniref:Secreted protein n=1 Tax=Champsocephalus gunnari TaxID=52237 RepID=A0AAN8E6Y2_CHAGU|nr:hypothetical protein CgunFtcFv8_020272 [Champsocephalus gunnari]
MHGGVSAVLVIWQTFILLSKQVMHPAARHIENWTGLQTLRDVDMELYTGLQRLEPYSPSPSPLIPLIPHQGGQVQYLQPPN